MVREKEKEGGVTLPITQMGREIAHRFAQPLTNLQLSAKAEQVQLNTLAVWVVKDYCAMLGIPTRLNQSDSWNPMMHLMGDLADLDIENVGKLECRPVREADDRCLVPPETWDLRVGYVVVAISANHKQATLLGFTPTVHDEVLQLQDLMSLDELIDHLYELSQVRPVVLEQDGIPQDEVQPDGIQQTTSQPSLRPVQLGEWFKAIFETGWQQVEDILTPESLTLVSAFRSPLRMNPSTSGNPPEGQDESGGDGKLGTDLDRVERAKLIDLGIQLAQTNVVLVVQLQQESTQKTGVTVQLYPGPGQVILPPGLELQVRDDAGEIFSQTQARNADNAIQLKFRGDRAESFQVAIVLGEVSVVEHFML